jgi:hypothetical protein
MACVVGVASALSRLRGLNEERAVDLACDAERGSPDDDHPHPCALVVLAALVPGETRTPARVAASSGLCAGAFGRGGRWRVDERRTRLRCAVSTRRCSTGAASVFSPAPVVAVPGAASVWAAAGAGPWIGAGSVDARGDPPQRFGLHRDPRRPTPRPPAPAPPQQPRRPASPPDTAGGEPAPTAAVSPGHSPAWPGRPGPCQRSRAPYRWGRPRAWPHAVTRPQRRRPHGQTAARPACWCRVRPRPSC